MEALKPAAEFEYSLRVRELFADMRHVGVLEPAKSVHCAAAGSYEQGARIRLQIDLQNERVNAVRYRAYGCPHFLAACEGLARWLEGRQLSDGYTCFRASLERELEFPAQKRARLLILEDALASMLAAGAAKPAAHPQPATGI